MLLLRSLCYVYILALWLWWFNCSREMLYRFVLLVLRFLDGLDFCFVIKMFTKTWLYEKCVLPILAKGSIQIYVIIY